MTLSGKTIALLIAPRGTEEPEFAEPKAALERAGAAVTVVSLDRGQAETVNGDLDPGSDYAVDKAIAAVSAEAFDGLVIPGGCVGADKLRGSKAVVGLVRDMAGQGKPLAAICHGPWVLIEAGVVKGCTLTSFPTLQTDIENAGGTWVDSEVVVDGGLVTSRTPKDLPAFCAKLVEAFALGGGRDGSHGRLG
jgi:protease I